MRLAARPRASSPTASPTRAISSSAALVARLPKRAPSSAAATGPKRVSLIWALTSARIASRTADESRAALVAASSAVAVSEIRGARSSVQRRAA